MIFDAHPPAVIRPAPLTEVRFGLTYAPSRIEYDRYRLPEGWQNASLEELRRWIPSELWDRVPHGMLWRSIIGLIAVPAPIPVNTAQVTTYFTSTSVSNQTYAVPSTFVSNVSVEVGSHGADGGPGSTVCCCGGTDVRGGDGGNSGGYAKSTGITMTPSTNVSYRLRAGASGGGTTNASWFGAATYAAVTTANGAAMPGEGGASTSGGKGTTLVGGNNGGSASGASGGSGGQPPAEESAICSAAGGGSSCGRGGDGGSGGGGQGSGGQAIMALTSIQ